MFYKRRYALIMSKFYLHTAYLDFTVLFNHKTKQGDGFSVSQNIENMFYSIPTMFNGGEIFMNGFHRVHQLTVLLGAAIWDYQMFYHKLKLRNGCILPENIEMHVLYGFLPCVSH